MKPRTFNYNTTEPTELISIQIYEGKEWSETKPTFHEVTPGTAGTLAKLIANSLQTQVRLTYPRNEYQNVCNLNGSYIHWDQFETR